MSDNQSEKSLLLAHEYDGIREYDNPMPGWWKAIFWTTFYFSIGYSFHYHISENGKSVALLYEDEVSAAREREAQELMRNAVSEEALSEFMNNTALMNDTAKLFLAKCAQCHGDKGEGKIGPNLTDEYWLHGDGSLMAIYNTVNEGVPAKGMPPWGRQLRPVELRKVAAFVGSLRGTNVPGPKGAEGTKVDLK